MVNSLGIVFGCYQVRSEIGKATIRPQYLDKLKGAHYLI